MHISPQKKLIAFVAVAIGVLAAFSWGFWALARNIRRSEVALGEIQSKIDGFASDRQHARTLTSVIRERQDDLVRIGGFFADRNRPIAFLQALEGLGRTTGNPAVIALEEGRNDDKHLAFRVEVEGSEQELMRFVRLLELMPYQINIQDMTYQKSAPDTVARSSIAAADDRLTVFFRVRAR